MDDVGARCDVLVCNFGRMACGLAKRFDAPPRVVGIPGGLRSYVGMHVWAALHPRAFVGPMQGACGAGDCSTGLRLFHMLLARGHVVHIHGFDHSHHHYGRYQGRGGAHDWAHQRAVMDRWLAEGRLRRVA